MRTILAGILIFGVLTIFAGALWWNAARIEAWAGTTQQERAKEQDRQRVRQAEVFLQKGLEELGCEIVRLEEVRYERRVQSEEAALRAGRQQNLVVEAEELAIEFARLQQANKDRPFEFCGRTFAAPQAEAQFENYVREALARRHALDELHYQEVSNRQAADYIGTAIKTLKEARNSAQQEGSRLLADRDVADARALAKALSDPSHRNLNGHPGEDLSNTLDLLRKHVQRREAEDRVGGQDGAFSVEETQHRKRELHMADELRQLKDDLRKRAEGGKP